MLPDLPLFLPFLLAATLLVVTPGPDTLFVASRSLAQGHLAGFVALLGISAGAVVHSAAAALGLASLFAVAPVLYEVVRWAGIAYLLWLAWGALRPGPATAAPENTPGARDLRRVFRQAMLTNLLNPKVILFMGAFLPQFTDPAQGRVGVQLFSLGCVIIAINTVWMAGVIYLAGSVGAWLARRPGLQRAQQVVLGGTLGAVAVWLAVSDRR